MNYNKITFKRDNDIYFETNISNMSISQGLLKTSNSNIKDIAIKLAIQLNENCQLGDRIFINDEPYCKIDSQLLDKVSSSINDISTPKTLKDFTIEELNNLLETVDLEIVKYNIRKEIESRV
jgi:hypothetical protein